MSDHDRNDERLARLIAATRAEADPAVLMRARARIAAMVAPGEPAWVRWLARPATLALSGGLLAVSVAAGGWLLSGVRTSATGTDSAAASVAVSDLLGNDGSYGLVFSDNASERTAVSDSGSIR